MKGIRCMLYLSLSYLLVFCSARHLLLESQAYPSESFELEEEELMKEKFQPSRVGNVLPKMKGNARSVTPTIGFLEAPPDVLLERLIDEADEYYNAADQDIIDSSILMDERKEDINDDLDETL